MANFFVEKFVDALISFLDRIIKGEVKKREFIAIFEEAGDFFGEFEMGEEAKRCGLQDVFSKENMCDIAKRILNKGGESLRAELEYSFCDKMVQCGVSEERISMFVNYFTEKAIRRIKRVSPQVYFEFSLKELSDQTKESMSQIEKRLSRDEYHIGQLQQSVASLTAQESVTDVATLRRKLHCLLEKNPKLERCEAEALFGRGWVFDELNAQIKKDKSLLMVILGNPGFGKTMLIAHAKNELPVKAIYSFDNRSEQYQSVDHCVAEIVCQLSENIPEYGEQVIDLFRNDRSFEYGCGIDRFRRLFVEPLGKITVLNDVVIAVDGIDESDNSIALIDYLAEFCEVLPTKVHFLMSSRKDDVIEQEIKGVERYFIIDLCRGGKNSYRKLAENDCRGYFAKKIDNKLKKASYPKKDRDAFYEKLSVASKGVFTYCKAICDIIIEDINKKKSVSFNLASYSLPKDMSRLFLQTMRRKKAAFSKYVGMSYLNYQAFWRKPLGMIIASPTVMTEDTLRQLLNWGKADFNDFIRPISSLIETSTSDDGDVIIDVFHGSFAEWLNDEASSNEFYTPKEDGLQALADECYDKYIQLRAKLDKLRDVDAEQKRNILLGLESKPCVLYLSFNLLWLLKETNMREAYDKVKGDKVVYLLLMGVCLKNLINSSYAKGAIKGLSELYNIYDDSSARADSNLYEYLIFTLLMFLEPQEIDDRLLNECESAWARYDVNTTEIEELISSNWEVKLRVMTEAFERKKQREKSVQYANQAIAVMKRIILVDPSEEYQTELEDLIFFCENRGICIEG